MLWYDFDDVEESNMWWHELTKLKSQWHKIEEIDDKDLSEEDLEKKFRIIGGWGMSTDEFIKSYGEDKVPRDLAEFIDKAKTWANAYRSSK